MSSIYKKFILPAFFVLSVISVVVTQMMQSDTEPNENTLIVGLQSGYPPFEYMNEEGDIVGFDIEIANIIAKKVNKNLIIKDMEFEGEILSLKQGKIDLIISGMNITPSRIKEIAMVPYHGEASSYLTLLFWNEIPQGVKTLEDLAKLPNASVSVESGAIPENYMSKYSQINTKSFQGALAPLMDVKYGKSTANLVEKDVANYLKTQHPQIKILEVPLAKEEMIMGFGIGIKKDNEELITQVQEIIQELKANGDLQKLENKWFKLNGEG